VAGGGCRGASRGGARQWPRPRRGDVTGTAGRVTGTAGRVSGIGTQRRVYPPCAETDSDRLGYMRIHADTRGRRAKGGGVGGDERAAQVFAVLLARCRCRLAGPATQQRRSGGRLDEAPRTGTGPGLQQRGAAKNPGPPLRAGSGRAPCVDVTAADAEAGPGPGPNGGVHGTRQARARRKAAATMTAAAATAARRGGRRRFTGLEWRTPPGRRPAGAGATCPRYAKPARVARRGRCRDARRRLETWAGPCAGCCQGRRLLLAAP
jgi:hypothetical protein